MIKVKVKFTVEGFFNIDAGSEHEAREIVNVGCSMMAGNISAGTWDDQVKDWTFPMHSEKEILSVVDETRIALKRQIEANTREGQIPVVVWGRDCDNAEATEIHSVDATIEAYQEFYYNVELNAEGPFSVTIVSPEEADNFEASFRDRAAEAAGY